MSRRTLGFDRFFGKTTYAKENGNIHIANRAFENVANLKYLERALTKQNFTQVENKRRLNSGNATI
jgi:hypothetical protein